MPPAALWSRTSTPMVGVAVGPAMSASRPVAVTAASTAAMNTGAETRPSWPDNNRTCLALAGVSRREFGGNHRVDPIPDNPAQSRDARDPGPLSAHQACPPPLTPSRRLAFACSLS